MQFTVPTEEPPLMEADVPTFDVERVARIEIFGPRARIIYFEYRFVAGVIVRMPVVCLNRQVSSMLPEALKSLSGLILRYDPPRRVAPPMI